MGEWSLMGIQIVQSDDGSNTAYSKLFHEHYHSTKDGALAETFVKHIEPAFNYVNKECITILDICFGLGYNTLATLYYRDNYFPDKKIIIYAPEFDKELISSLTHFEYPEIFKEYLHIIQALVHKQKYSDARTQIELYLGDARDYIRKFQPSFFDVVYQDAFSPSVNPLLWTKEYFQDISRIIKDEGILTTYSIALQVRLALYENGFLLYLQKNEKYRDSTIASKKRPLELEEVDMKHKILCNKNAQSLSDFNFN